MSYLILSQPYLAVDSDRPVEDTVHSQDGRLRWVDDGGAEHAAVDAAVTDRESSAVHVLDSDLVVTSLGRQTT